MGQPKLVLPWGKHSVIEEVVSTLLQTGIEEITVVTGGARELVDTALSGKKVRLTHNPDFENGEMIISLQLESRPATRA